jgi:hypothetical protein
MLDATGSSPLPWTAPNTRLFNKWYNRPYTGATGGKQVGQLMPGVKWLCDNLCYFFGFVQNGGTGNESVITSVHWTGRAFDINYKKSNDLDKDFRFRNINVFYFLSLYADILGVEEIHDYCGLYVPGTKTKFVPEYSRGIMAPPEKYPERNMWGAGYRCNREGKWEVPYFFGWKVWDEIAHKAHNGKTVGDSHIHIEVSPSMAGNLYEMQRKFDWAIRHYRPITTWVTFD